ncbi:MAG TPA: nuclear transport factor 2 family protein [Anaerolineae bacterium]|nr:nuclear transport factor 2 family protein [Anaerolineae bacterium]
MKMTVSAIEVVKEFYRRMNTNDFHSAGQLLSDSYILEWPQSKERIRGRDNFVAVNNEYPAYGRWLFTINRLVGNATEAVSDVSITDGTQVARAITFTTVQEGKIVKQVEFWPENYDPPENRKHLVEVME